MFLCECDFCFALQPSLDDSITMALLSHFTRVKSTESPSSLPLAQASLTMRCCQDICSDPYELRFSSSKASTVQLQLTCRTQICNQVNDTLCLKPSGFWDGPSTPIPPDSHLQGPRVVKEYTRMPKVGRWSRSERQV